MYSNLDLSDDVSWVAEHAVQALRGYPGSWYFAECVKADCQRIRKEYGHNG